MAHQKGHPIPPCHFHIYKMMTRTRQKNKQQPILWQTDFNQEKSVGLTSELNYAFDEASMEYFYFQFLDPRAMTDYVNFGCELTRRLKVSKSIQYFHHERHNLGIRSVCVLVFFSSSFLSLSLSLSLVLFHVCRLLWSQFDAKQFQCLFRRILISAKTTNTIH